jgi:subfamily B ATP-binding cassette protein MsbA
MPGSSTGNIDVIRMLGRVAGIKPWHYALPLLLALAAALLEGASMALLLPLAKGLAQNDFGFVWQLPGVRELRSAFPDPFGASGSNRLAFLLIVGVLFTATLLSLLFGHLAARMCLWRDGMFVARVKSHTLARCLSFGKLYFDRASQANVSDAIGYSEFVLRLLTAIEAAIGSAVRLAVQGVVMLTISWPLTLFLSIALPVLRAIDRRIVRRSRTAVEKGAQAELVFSRQVHNALSSVPLIKSHGLEARTQTLYDQLIEQVRRHALMRDTAHLAAAPLQQAATLFALLVLVTAAVFMTPGDRTVELSTICAFLLVARRTVPLLGFATELRIKLTQTRPYLDQLAAIFTDREKFFVASGTRQFDGLRRGIELDDLWFSYVDGAPVLQGLSAFLPAGRTTALVGETGCGKTTVASIVARLYECPPGSVRLDGVDIREFSHQSLASRIAFVGQEAWLFNDSIRVNLCVGLEREVSDAELHDVLERVRLGPLLASLPAGLDTGVGDRGVRLSGGEKQRLCIARAILRRADLLVLDEATASLDSETERDILDALEHAARGRTVIVIAHRLSTVRDADQILVLSRGQVIQTGTWTQLVNQPGPFATMWDVQTRAGRTEVVPAHDADAG